ncbi:MAG: GDSL-type esterase/lipase family protein [Flavobacteriales bacterium]
MSMRRHAPLLLLLLGGAAMMPRSPIVAQDLAALKELPFLGHASNRIELHGDPTTWNVLHSRMDDLLFKGIGQVNVVHIGGSHVQADMWSMQVRHRLQSMAPGVRAGRGFIFPYTLAKSNNPFWYEPVHTGIWSAVRNVNRADSSLLGLAGISATTRDSLATLRISFRGEVYAGYTFDRVELFHNMDSCMTITVTGANGLEPKSVTVDSVTQRGIYHFDRPTDTLHVRVVRTDSTQRFTLRGIELGSSDPGIFLHACGVNGASTTSWLRCQAFSEELAVVGADLVILSIGINDAHDPDFDAQRFKRNYAALIDRIRQAHPDAAVLLTSNTDSYVKRRTPNRNAEAVRQVMRELSAETGAGVWDALGVMGGVGSIRLWESAGLAKRDRIHLTREGYALLGDLLFDAWQDLYDAHLRSLPSRP